mmetsp:Transcript_5836/g.7360  ORF Transcript_5836/g.7360 Transcript_5836/m.7360 type:complete len:231 (-) Transcript_5836:354-1046(-)
MGNSITTTDSTRLAIDAMAFSTSIDKRQLITLRKYCLRFLSRGGDRPVVKTILRKDFHNALEKAGVENDTLDWEIFDCLFTMFDTTGDDRITPSSLLVGISPLAVTSDASSKLLFAFEIFDVKKTGKVNADEIMFVLGNINAVASSFGDSVLTTAQIELLSHDILFLAQTIEGQRRIDYREYIDDILLHPLSLTFISGASAIQSIENRESSSARRIDKHERESEQYNLVF